MAHAVTRGPGPDSSSANSASSRALVRSRSGVVLDRKRFSRELPEHVQPANPPHRPRPVNSITSRSRRRPETVAHGGIEARP